jgi:hypothetical protein
MSSFTLKIIGTGGEQNFTVTADKNLSESEVKLTFDGLQKLFKEADTVKITGENTSIFINLKNVSSIKMEYVE